MLREGGLIDSVPLTANGLAGEARSVVRARLEHGLRNESPHGLRPRRPELWPTDQRDHHQHDGRLNT
jgi:hypothetical protein